MGKNTAIIDPHVGAHMVTELVIRAQGEGRQGSAYTLLRVGTVGPSTALSHRSYCEPIWIGDRLWSAATG